MSIAPTQRDVVLQAVARGWCHEANSAKEMDSDLAEAITAEVCAALAEQAEPVVWECKAGGLKPLTQSQYDRQSDAIKRHYSRVEAPATARQEPLTDAQIAKAADAIDDEAAFSAGFYEGARFAERAHGIE